MTRYPFISVHLMSTVLAVTLATGCAGSVNDDTSTSAANNKDIAQTPDTSPDEPDELEIEDAPVAPIDPIAPIDPELEDSTEETPTPEEDAGDTGEEEEPIAVDADSDGFTVDEGDCDDFDDSRHPGREDVADGIDNDCDDLIDEDAIDEPEVEEEPEVIEEPEVEEEPEEEPEVEEEPEEEPVEEREEERDTGTVPPEFDDELPELEEGSEYYRSFEGRYRARLSIAVARIYDGVLLTDKYRDDCITELELTYDPRAVAPLEFETIDPCGLDELGLEVELTLSALLSEAGELDEPIRLKGTGSLTIGDSSTDFIWTGTVDEDRLRASFETELVPADPFLSHLGDRMEISGGVIGSPS